MNCGQFFPRTKATRKFCEENCRKEFHRFGAAYGPLKAQLEKLVHTETKVLGMLLAELKTRVEALEKSRPR